MWDLLTPAEIEFKERCRRFAAEAIAPCAREYDEANAFPAKVHARAYEAGLMNLGFPAALGGQGASHRTLVVGGEELAAACAPSAFTMGFNHGSLRPVLDSGTPEQQQRFVRDLLGRREYASICLTEEQASGSNLFEIATRAVRTDRGWAIDGAKCMIGNGCVSKLFLVLADAVVEGRRRGPTFFAVPLGPGVHVGPNPPKLGFRCLTTPVVRFEGVEVADDCRLGGVGEAEQALLRSLDYMRFGGASVILGIVVGALREALPWLEDRKLFLGEPLVAKSHVQLELGEVFAEVQLVRMVLWRAADLLDAGRRCSTETSIAKLRASKLALDAMNRLVQMHGWRGIHGDFGMEKRLRDARVTTIYEGTSEIQAMSLFRELRRSVHGNGYL